MIALFLFTLCFDVYSTNRNMATFQDRLLRAAQEEPSLFLKVSTLEEIDFADTITFAVTGVRMDKIELVELNYIHAELHPKGEVITLAIAEGGDFSVYDNYLYVASFPPLSAAGDYEVVVEASWKTPWDTFVNSSSTIYFHIDHWRDISQVGEQYLDELDRKANDIIYGINLLETSGDDILSIMTTRIACIEILHKALLVWSSLPPFFDFTIINLDGYNEVGVSTDRNTTLAEEQFNESVTKLAEIGQTYTARYVRTISQLDDFLTLRDNYTSGFLNAIVFNLHGSFFPIPESLGAIADYPQWIDKLRNATQAGQWMWISLGRGTPLRYVTWFNTTSGSYTFRPISNALLLSYFYKTYQATFEEDFDPDLVKTFTPRYWSKMALDEYGGQGNGEGWQAFADINGTYHSPDGNWYNREFGDPIANTVSLLRDKVEDGIYTRIGHNTFETETTSYEWGGQSPTFTFDKIAALSDIMLQYRSSDYIGYAPWWKSPDPATWAVYYPPDLQNKTINCTMTFRYKYADDLTALRAASWNEVVLPDAYMNFTWNGHATRETGGVNWYAPNPYGLGDAPNQPPHPAGWNEFQQNWSKYGYPNTTAPTNCVYGPNPHPNYGDGYFGISRFKNAMVLPIDYVSSTGQLHVQFNMTYFMRFEDGQGNPDPLFLTLSDWNYQQMGGDRISPYMNTVSFSFAVEPPANFTFIDQVPETLPLNFTVTEGSYAPNGTTAFKTELVDYTEGLLSVVLPDEENTSYSWHLPSLYDARKFYFTFNGDIALGMRVAIGGTFLHSVMDARTTTLCAIGGIWRAYEETVVDVIDDLTKIFYKTQYEYPTLANESTNIKWDLIKGWNAQNLTLVRSALVDSVYLANDTFALYDDPLESTFNFTFQIARINISASVEDLQEAANETQTLLQAEALEAAAALNETLDQVHITKTITDTLFSAMFLMFFGFLQGAIVAGIFGDWGAAVGFSIAAAAAAVGMVGIARLGRLLQYWERQLITTIKVVVSKALAEAAGQVSRAIATAVNLVTDIVEDLEYRINVLLKDLQDTLNDFADKVRDAIVAVLELIVRIRSEVFDFIKDALRLIKDFFIIAFTSLLDGVTSLADTLSASLLNLQKSAAFVPQLAGSVLRTVTQAARDSEFVRYILDVLGVTDQAFELAENVANVISNSRMADVGLGIIVANPMLEKDVPSILYLLGLSYGELYDLSSLSVNISNSATFYYEYPNNITRISTGVYKLRATIPEGEYTLAANFFGSEQAYATERITAGREYFLADLQLLVALETDKESYRAGDTVHLKIWTTNLMYAYAYVTVEVRLIEKWTHLVILSEQRLGLFINSEETKITSVSITIPWYTFPGDYILEVTIIEPTGDRETVTYSIKIEWGLATWIFGWHPALVFGGFPLALIFYALLFFYMGKWSVSKGYGKLRKKKEKVKVLKQRRKK